MMSHLLCRRFHGFKVFAIALSSLCLTTAGMAGDLNYEIGLNYGWLDSAGNPESFRSRTNISEGASLEDFQLNFQDGSIRQFRIRAWGFGDAESREAFRLDLKTISSLNIRVNYDHHESFFALSDPDHSSTRENWDIDRWMADFSWAGWEHWGIGLSYHRTDRRGSIHRPDYGLNETYPIRLSLDETMDDLALRLESHGLPVYLLFEQSFARYTRHNRPLVDGSVSITNPEDPDVLTEISSNEKDSVDIPTSRVMASWNTGRWEGLLSLLSSNADLDSTGGLSRSYAVDGGTIGEMNFVDQVASSTQQDMLSGAIRLGFALSSSWTLRLSGTYRDSSSDSALFGRRLLRAINPAGDSFDLEGTVDDNGFYDFTDSSARLSIEYDQGRLKLWGGALTGSRDVSWQRAEDGENFKVTRDTEGYLFGLGWSQGPFDATAEYEHGSFEHYVFRTDPEQVDRLTLRLRARVDENWSMGFHGRFESSENPSDRSSLDRDAQAWGVSFGWNSADARQGLNLNFDRNTLTSEIGILLPNSRPGFSLYDLDLSTFSLSGHSRFGITRLKAAVTRIEDQGMSFPLSAWNASGRLGWETSPRLRLGIFAQYWDYDEDASNLDDFSATRYGVFLHWSSRS